jgi:uncharacterized membrane protein
MSIAYGQLSKTTCRLFADVSSDGAIGSFIIVYLPRILANVKEYYERIYIRDHGAHLDRDVRKAQKYIPSLTRLTIPHIL